MAPTTDTSKPLAGMSAFITGGGGGIGGASAAWLARDGAAVTIMGRTEATLSAKRDQILAAAGSGAQVDTFVGDALGPQALSQALAAAEATTGRLAMAVSVVGGGTIKQLLMFEPDEVMHELN